VGSVHAYVLGPDGSVRDSLHTAQAAKADVMLAMLERSARDLNVVAGAPVVNPTPQPPPPCAPSEMQLSLTARYLEKRGDGLAPVQTDSGDWSSLPSQDWISLTPEDRRKLVPTGNLRPGREWTMDDAVANKLLVHFYPPTENWEVDNNAIHESRLDAHVESVAGGTARIGLIGKLKMDHWFYHKPDGRYVEADIVGYADVEQKSGRILKFNLVTERAAYRGAGQELPFGVAVRLQPR
jgi:hypothetical protein